MTEIQCRYSKITNKFPREFILLQGKGCFWKKCRFCDYYEDVSADPFKINKPVIEQLTGEFGVVDAINSGSALEIDKQTLDFLIKKVSDLKIKEIWFEVHWAYKDKLNDFAKLFKNCEVKFRTGIETFNPVLRSFWNKGIPESVTAQEVAKYFKSVCILVGTEQQTFEDVTEDIKTAEKYFDHCMVNVFVPNDSEIKPNFDLIKRFMNEIYPNIKDNPKMEISINNTDLGVG